MRDMTNVTHLHTRVPVDTLGARLILLRHELGWSQRDAAIQTGVSYRTWQGMEAGRETRSLDQHVAAIAAVTGYDRNWLMWGGALSQPQNPRPSVPASSPLTRGYDAVAEYDALIYHFPQRDCGLEGSIHRMRHTFATDLLRAGVNVRVVQELMRHASLESTMVYTAVDEVERRDAINLLSAA